MKLPGAPLLIRKPFNFGIQNLTHGICLRKTLVPLKPSKSTSVSQAINVIYHEAESLCAYVPKLTFQRTHPELDPTLKVVLFKDVHGRIIPVDVFLDFVSLQD